MDAITLNEILTFLNADFRVTEKLPASGQREVFYGNQISTGYNCVIKQCVITPINVGRIQREIRILSDLDSEYFPKLFYQTFITDTILLDFYDSFDMRDNDQRKRLDQINKMRIVPFLLTSEEQIDHLQWEVCIEELKKEKNLVDFLIDIFQALSLLWDVQVAHRDLKPDNILIRPNFKPVIIDLGIAKSFRSDTQEFTVFQTPCTPRFAAPEQLTNTKTDITYKTDQFAVGVIAYLILTGQFPYGDVCQIQAQIIDNFRQENIRNIHDYNESVNIKLVDFIEKLLQVHPYKRFRNIKTILQSLYEIRETTE